MMRNSNTSSQNRYSSSLDPFQAVSRTCFPIFNRNEESVEVAYNNEDEEQIWYPSDEEIIIGVRSDESTFENSRSDQEEPSTAAADFDGAQRTTKNQPEQSIPPTIAATTPSRWVQVYTTADWWSMWVGLISFAFAVNLVFCVLAVIEHNGGGDDDVDDTDDDLALRIRYLVPQPMSWDQNPIDAWDLYGGVGTILLLFVLGSFYLLSCLAVGNEAYSLTLLARGFAYLSLVATLALWLGKQQFLSTQGLGYAIWSIVFGMILGNVPRSKTIFPALHATSKDGEFMIKCTLVLLAVQFSVLAQVGWPALVVAWIGSPLALILSILVGMYLFRMEAASTVLISVGATWCGASAMSAVGSVIGSQPKELSLCISIVSFATVVFTFAQAYLAIVLNMPDDIAGAWIGGSVDQTGNVVASASIISERATEIAGIVKIVLNSALGILTTVIALWWQTRRVAAEDGTANGGGGADNKGRAKKPAFSWLFLWDKFPKFVLGYLICSALLSIIVPQIEGSAEGEALPIAVTSLNQWWFALSFVAIGATTNVTELWEAAVRSGVVKLYLVSNTLDILISLGLAYLVF